MVCIHRCVFDGVLSLIGAVGAVLGRHQIGQAYTDDDTVLAAFSLALPAATGMQFFDGCADTHDVYMFCFWRMCAMGD